MFSGLVNKSTAPKRQLQVTTQTSSVKTPPVSAAFARPPLSSRSAVARSPARPASAGGKAGRSNGSRASHGNGSSRRNGSAHPDSDGRIGRRRRTPRARSSSAAIDFASSTSEDDSGNDSDNASTPASKRRRTAALDASLGRDVRLLDAFTDSPDQKDFAMIHGADIPKHDRTTKFEPVLTNADPSQEVLLRYPSRSQRERYTLIRPAHDDAAFNSITDIAETMRTVARHYVPDEQREIFDNEMTGFAERLHRAVKKQTLADIIATVQDYNDRLGQLLEEGAIARHLDAVRVLPLELVERILNQAYTRTVSPNLKSLKRYDTGTDNVYGELLPRFVSDIVRRDVRMRPDQVFVDLGSGVGNVVLQAALEVGCESWGCEMMNDYCDVAEAQYDEFRARCRLWGLNAGDVHLERGDFLANEAIKRTLTRADVVLVNNQVFTPKLNDALTTLFLDLKEGAKIVSLKSFVPAGHKITERNAENPINLLRVEPKLYFSNCVSWTSQGGSYYISTKDSSLVTKFYEQR